jgi:hypothetical protein
MSETSAKLANSNTSYARLPIVIVRSRRIRRARQTGSPPLSREPSPHTIGSGAAWAEHGTRGEFAADLARHPRQTAFGRRPIGQMLTII